jgi:hypothetical protein
MYVIRTMEAVHVWQKHFKIYCQTRILGPAKLLLLLKKCLVYVWNNRTMFNRLEHSDYSTVCMYYSATSWKVVGSNSDKFS